MTQGGRFSMAKDTEEQVRPRTFCTFCFKLLQRNRCVFLNNLFVHLFE